jgi:hypothetical protein
VPQHLERARMAACYREKDPPWDPAWVRRILRGIPHGIHTLHPHLPRNAMRDCALPALCLRSVCTGTQPAGQLDDCAEPAAAEPPLLREVGWRPQKDPGARSRAVRLSRAFAEEQSRVLTSCVAMLEQALGALVVADPEPAGPGLEVDAGAAGVACKRRRRR